MKHPRSNNSKNNDDNNNPMVHITSANVLQRKTLPCSPNSFPLSLRTPDGLRIAFTELLFPFARWPHMAHALSSCIVSFSRWSHCQSMDACVYSNYVYNNNNDNNRNSNCITLIITV